MSRITTDDVKKVAKLACLDLEDKKITAYTEQLERILDYVAHLEQVDTTNVAPTTHIFEIVNSTRSDEVVTTFAREMFLDLAPQREGNFFHVPKILTEN